MTEERLKALLVPYVETDGMEAIGPSDLYSKLLAYLELLLRWNARTNLTAVRDEETIVTRHFGEGLFAAGQLAGYLPAGAELLDVGSGAGFPGLPIQLVCPEVRVTLAESQGKKASFLREAVRVLGLETEVWAGRVEALAPERLFDVVTLRAVDRMEIALEVGSGRVRPGGVLAELTSHTAAKPARLISVGAAVMVPGSERRVLRLWALG